VQAYFNSTQNHEYECPFCPKKAQIILSEQMLVGDAQQLDYQRTIDKSSNVERLNLANQMGILGTTVLMTAQSNFGGRTSMTMGSEVVSQAPEPFLDEMIEQRP